METGSELSALLQDTRTRTLGVVADLTEDQFIVPRLPIVNPILWEIGHVAWFQEFWILRHLRGDSPNYPNADALWDSARVAHPTRWELPLPSRKETEGYLQEILDRSLRHLADRKITEREDYFFRLVTFHEDMHHEAFTYTRQTLGYPEPAPPGTSRISGSRPVPNGSLPGDVEIPGGSFQLGSTPDDGFVFDNEKWAHPVRIPAFAMAKTTVTCAQFLAFVEDGGYGRRKWWSDDGWQWRSREKSGHPVYWRHDSDGRWYRRCFDRWIPLEGNHPVHHVSWYEAEAWCQWAGRRLPTEAEWEMAASIGPAGEKRRFPWGNGVPNSERANLDGRSRGCLPVDAVPAGDSPFGCRQMIGNVWEWTASTFAPYPDFVVDPYREYSLPWFSGDFKVLRGGSWVTPGRLLRSSWRNFYTPDRRDIFAGFRTCPQR